MTGRNLLRGLVLAAALAAMPLVALADAVKVAIHVGEENASIMNMALNNATNIMSHYAGLNQEVVVEIVTYGPGLHMLRADTSPVKDRIEAMALTYENLSFSACMNTVEAMKKQSQKDVPLLEEATEVPSGAVRLMELQFAGYAYLRP